jgi:hypothetical protein
MTIFEGEPMFDRDWPVLAHVNAVSLLDEGTDAVLDFLQGEAAADGVLLAVHGFNPEVMDRGRIWPGHGPRGPSGGHGGCFARLREPFGRGLHLGSPRVKEPQFADFDALAAAAEAADARGLGLHIYILESASTGGYQRNVEGWPAVLEIDVHGRRDRLPCVNHPDYRAWKMALLEDLYGAYAFDGLLWGVERWGPLHQALAGEAAGCFCEHCRLRAEAAGLDWHRVIEGYRALDRALAEARGESAAPAAALRVLLHHPEILGWEACWTGSYLGLHREIYGVVKWLAPDRLFGLGLWHYYFINPLLRAEWDMADFAVGADYIRPILYHLPEGPRIDRYLTSLSRTALGGVERDTAWRFFQELLGLPLPPLREIDTTGLPASYVGQGIHAVRAALPGKTPIMAGIGIDVFEHGLQHAMRPEDVEEAIIAAHAAGADGITLSRNYAEMQHPNLRAAGATVRRLRAGGLARG